MPEPLLIADVPWLLYRAFFSLPKSIVGADGQPVNALLGTVNALLSVIEARPPRAVAACFGAEEATYRVKLYPPYHAHRDPMPPELAAQWKKAPALLESLGWITGTSETLEADDVMFSFALAETAADGHRGGEGNGHKGRGPTGGGLGSDGRALLLTGDRDLFQAVGDRVAVVTPGKGGEAPIEIGPAQVRERYGIDPPLVPDFIALRGDPSDGIPGAPGIGEKTAAELLSRYGALEEVLSAARAAESLVRSNESDIRPRAAAALRENAALLRAFKEIATLVPIDEITRPSDRATDFSSGARAARELGMKRLAERLEQITG
jgi:5'-3' exonuclease